MGIKVISRLISIIFFTILVGCNNSNPSSDIYNKIPKNSFLSREILANSIQVYRADSLTLSLYDIEDDTEEYNVHLLFWDKGMKLCGASYFASEKIDSIVGTIIYAVENRERSNRINRYRRDIPEGYSIELVKNENDGKSMVKGNKIIIGFKYKSLSMDSIEFNFLTDKEDPYAFINIDRNELKNLVVDSLQKTNIIYNLSDLTLDLKHMKIFYNYYDASNYKIVDEMVFLNNELRDSFIVQTWNKIQKKSSD